MTKKKGTHWVSLFFDRSTVVYIDSSGNEYILEEVSNKVKDKSITRKMFRMEDDDSIMYGFYCITFIEYIFTEKHLLDNTNLFSLKDYRKIDKIICKCFKEKYITSVEFRFKKR